MVDGAHRGGRGRRRFSDPGVCAARSSDRHRPRWKWRTFRRPRSGSPPNTRRRVKLLTTGQAGKAAEILTKLDAQTEPPQPQRNWITLHAGLAELLAGRADHAQAHFATLEKRGLYSPEPAEQALASFFVQTARRMSAAAVITSESANDARPRQSRSDRPAPLRPQKLVLGAYDESWQLFRQYSLATPQDHAVWVSDYKPLASPYVSRDQFVSRGLRSGEEGLDPRPAEARAAGSAGSAGPGANFRGHFPGQLEALAKDLAQKITAEEEETARRLAAIASGGCERAVERQKQTRPALAAVSPGRSPGRRSGDGGDRRAGQKRARSLAQEDGMAGQIQGHADQRPQHRRLSRCL